ncbi:leucine rich repeat family protein [Cryptosporidium andersoni]|uniref:Leucine rich repeat family protein n=1 Tax=Cryptosporidium andersoni TaxID=117008 RepID=A0A1J4MHY9_9CRYT|nr:leucine rich repeat family protein [Cryptosporidium andersoni]
MLESVVNINNTTYLNGFLEPQVVRLSNGRLFKPILRNYSDRAINEIYQCLRNQGVAITESFLFGLSGPNRETIKLCGCSGVKTSALNYVLFHSPNIRILDLSNCLQVNNRLIRSTINNCGKLRELYISGCKLVTDSAFSPYMFSPTFVHSVSNLTVLDVSNCPQITDLGYIIKLAPKIERLNVSNCRNLKGSTFTNLLESAIFLKELNISSCDSIKDEDIKINLMGNLLLEKLILGRCKFSCEILSALFSILPNLLHLDLRYSLNINDSIIKILSISSPNIENLILRSCAGITDYSCFLLMNRLLKIKCLDLSWCPMLSVKSLYYLALRFSNSNTSSLTSLSLSQSINLDQYIENSTIKESSSSILDNISTFSLTDEYSEEACTKKQRVNMNNEESEDINMGDLESKINDLIISLNISSSMTGGGSIPLSLCCILKQNEKSLETLELDGLANLVTRDVLLCIANCHNLKTLTISLNGHQQLCNDLIQKIGIYCKYLRNLTLDLSLLTSRESHTKYIEALNSKVFPQLEQITLRASISLGLSNEEFLAISKNMSKQLKSLTINNVQGLTNDFIMANHTYFRDLFINLDHLTLCNNEDIQNSELLKLLNYLVSPIHIEILNFKYAEENLAQTLWNKYNSLRNLVVVNIQVKSMLQRL